MRLLLVLLLSASAAAAEGLPTRAAHEVVVVPPAEHPLRGPRYALVTLEVFVAFGHLPSAQVAELARRAAARDPGEVREVMYVVGYGPPGADLAAEAALEAEAQGRFWPFVDRMLTRDHLPPLTAPDLVRVGREAGLDADALAEALQSRRHHEAVERRTRSIRALGHNAAELVLNGRRHYALTDDAVQAAVHKAAAHARELIGGGLPLSRLHEHLLDEVQRETANAGAGPGARRRIAVAEGGAPSRGPSLAPLTVVAFANLSCTSCAEVAQALRGLEKRHPGKVRVVWKHWLPPWGTTTLEGVAVELAALAESQGRFWELLDAAMPPRAPRPVRTRADLEAAARAAGVDLKRGGSPDAAARARSLVERDLTEARRLELRWGPVLLVNGVPLAGAQAVEKLERLAAEELQRGLRERLRP